MGSIHLTCLRDAMATLLYHFSVTCDYTPDGESKTAYAFSECYIVVPLHAKKEVRKPNQLVFMSGVEPVCLQHIHIVSLP